MRIVVAPDEFTGSLTAPAAARAIADGWARTAPGDVLDLCPLSDGGPGFVDTLAAALGGELISATVSGPLGQQVPAAVLLVDDTAYIESAQACGIHLLGPDERDPRVTTSLGVGQMLRLAVSLRPKRIVVGLGGSGTNDGGAGLLAALGATADIALDAGGAHLSKLTQIDVGPARAALSGIELIAATDVDNPLLGLTGASKTFGPQKGADDNTVQVLDAALEVFATAVGRRPDGKDPAVALGAGAAGGLGYALLHLGAQRAPGIATVLAATNFEARVRASDLVVTGEGCFDWQSLRGKVVSGVATVTMPTARPCIVIAGDVKVGRREYSALGISSAYPVADFAGSVQESMSDPVRWLQTASERVARTWSR